MPEESQISSWIEQMQNGTLEATSLTAEMLRDMAVYHARTTNTGEGSIDNAYSWLQTQLNGIAGVSREISDEPQPEPALEVLYPNFGTRASIRTALQLEIMPEIPENSQTLSYQETTSRFSSAIWYENITTKNVLLVGLGGIGSYVAYNIARLRPYRLTLYDNDKVEAGNMSGQLFGMEDINKYKVDTVKDKLSRFCNYNNTSVHRERFVEGYAAQPITICGLDNMEARKTVYNAWKTGLLAAPEDDRKKWLFIDGRLAAEELQVFCMTGDDSYSQEIYEREWLFSDEEADATVCSYKQTTYVANLIGAFITNLFINFCANECDPIVPRDLPFFTSYDASTMFFKTQV